MNETDSNVYNEVIEDPPEYYDVTELNLSDINREDPTHHTIQESSIITGHGIQTNGNISPERGPNHVTSQGIESNDNTSPERGPNHATSQGMETNDNISPEIGPNNINIPMRESNDNPGPESKLNITNSPRRNNRIYTVIIVSLVIVVIALIATIVGLLFKDNTAEHDVTERLTNTSLTTTTVQFIENETAVYTEEYLKERIENLAAQFAQYADKVEDLENRLQKVEEGKDARYQSTFIALRAEDMERKFTSYQNILFTHTDLNPGGHYNLTTGSYTCPVNGIYFFSLTLSSYNYLSAFISLGGTQLEIAFQRSDGFLATITGSVVLYCKAGRTASPKATHGANLKHGPNMSTFSGFLIAEV